MPNPEEKYREVLNLIKEKAQVEYSTFTTIARTLVDDSRAGKFSLSNLFVYKECGDNVVVRVILNDLVLFQGDVNENKAIKLIEGVAPDIQGMLEVQFKRNGSTTIPVISSIVLEYVK